MTEDKITGDLIARLDGVYADLRALPCRATTQASRTCARHGLAAAERCTPCRVAYWLEATLRALRESLR